MNRHWLFLVPLVLPLTACGADPGHVWTWPVDHIRGQRAAAALERAPARRTMQGRRTGLPIRSRGKAQHAQAYPGGRTVPSPICLAPSCDQPSRGAFLCGSCTRTLGRDLDSVPVLLEDLEVTICRQDKLSDPSGRTADERPLPLRMGPVEARRDIAETLRVWALHVRSRARGGEALTGPAEHAAYLRLCLNDIGTDPDAGQLADEIGYAVILAQRTVDKPLQHQYVGPCVCGADLYAHPKAADVTCRNTPCEREYPVKERREWLLEQISDQLLTATEISRAIPNLLQQQITASMIRGLAHRGKLTPHPPLPERPREPVYRIGDAVKLLTEIAELVA